MKALIADDQPIVIEGLKCLFSRCPDLGVEVVASAHHGWELLERFSSLPADLLILELSLAHVDGFTVLKKIRAKRPDMSIVVYSRFDDPKIVKSILREGVAAYLLKNGPLEEWAKALKAVRNRETYIGSGIQQDAGNGPAYGRAPEPQGEAREDLALCPYSLTRRESEILQLIAQALSNKEIAGRLYISDQTVSVHRKNIMRKLGVSNTAGLVKLAYENSLV